MRPSSIFGSRASSRRANAVIAWVCVCGAVTGLFAACILLPDLWDWLGVFHIRPYFADLAAILAASDAHAAGLDPYAIPSPLDPFGRPHVYGPWWLYLHKLGLGMGALSWAGALLFFVSIAALAWVLRPQSAQQRLLTILLLASPPLLLAYERGNNDLVVALLLIVAGASGASSAGLAWRGVCVWAAAMLKFYPVAALGLLTHGRVGGGRRAWWALGLVGAAGAATWWIWRGDFARAVSAVPQPSTLYSYGARLVVEVCLALASGPRIAVYLGTLAVGAWVVWLSGALSGGMVRAMTRDTRCGAWFVGAGACWAFCFLLNNNFPYRAVLLVLAASVWFELWREGAAGEQVVARRLIWILAGMLWLRSGRVWLACLAWDHFDYPGLVLLGLEHGLAVGLTAVVVWSLARFAWERARSPAV